MKLFDARGVSDRELETAQVVVTTDGRVLKNRFAGRDDKAAVIVLDAKTGRRVG